MKSKNILVLSNMYPKNSTDYFGVFVKKISGALKTEYITKELFIKGKSNFVIIKVLKYLVFFIKTIASVLFKKHEFIYVHYPALTILPFLFVPIFSHNKLILHFHGTDVHSDNIWNSIFYKYLNPKKLNLKLAIFPSEYLLSVFNKNASLDCETLIYPSGGVPDFFFKNNNKMSTRALKFVYISTINEKKGVFDLISAMNIVKEKHLLNVNLDIYGGGNVSKLKNKILNSKNITYKGSVRNDDIPSALKEYDVFIFPSKLESLGLVGIEALACGLPIIASDIPSINSYLINGINGLLFQAGNVDDLAEKIKLIIEEKELFQKLSKNSSYSVKNFKSSFVNETLLKKIHDVI